MKLLPNQTVYIITEDFTPKYHFRIAKCKVEGVPNEHFSEYKLIERRAGKPLKMYWHKRNRIYDTMQQAIDEAEKEVNKYEQTWNTELIRPWR